MNPEFIKQLDDVLLDIPHGISIKFGLHLDISYRRYNCNIFICSILPNSEWLLKILAEINRGYRKFVSEEKNVEAFDNFLISFNWEEVVNK